jgi:hypothetical protein
MGVAGQLSSFLGKGGFERQIAFCLVFLAGFRKISA